MSCEMLKNYLASGVPLPSGAQEHLRECAGCQALVEHLESPPEFPDEERLEKIRQVITSSMKPVRPLPSDETMRLIALAVFTLFTLGITMPLGFQGFHGLSAWNRIAYYGILLGCAWLFSNVVIAQIVPASKRRVHPVIAGLLSLFAVALVVSLIYRSPDLNQFAARGISCFRVGVITSCAVGGLAYSLTRRGFSVSRARTGAAIGFFAGLAGVSVLALNCPLHDASHVIVWHLGAMLLAGLAGIAIGTWRERPPPRLNYSWARQLDQTARQE